MTVNITRTKVIHH